VFNHELMLEVGFRTVEIVRIARELSKLERQSDGVREMGLMFENKRHSVGDEMAHRIRVLRTSRFVNYYGKGFFYLYGSGGGGGW
jgi:hypothetical protein